MILYPLIFEIASLFCEILYLFPAFSHFLSNHQFLLTAPAPNCANHKNPLAIKESLWYTQYRENTVIFYIYKVIFYMYKEIKLC